MTIRLATATRTSMVSALATYADSGGSAALIRLYSGSQPASANSAPSGSLLATITCADPAFDSVSAGVATFDTTPALSTSAAGDGDIGWFRMITSDGDTVIDGSVGVSGSGADLIVNSVTTTVGLSVSVTAGSITMPAG
jgi:hypothetical protein